MKRQAVWHPNTQMSEWEHFDQIVRGDGMWLVDSTGHRMMDAVASMWCNVWGHSEPELIEALSRQAAQLQHAPLFNLSHPPAQLLAEYMLDICPGMESVFYSDNGSTAMEVAFKMAVQYWGNQGDADKTGLVGLSNGYHGDTLGAMMVGSTKFFERFSGMVQQRPAFNVPGRDSAPEAWNRCLDGVAERAETDTTLAAIIMESGAQVAGGPTIYPEGFQSGISRICRKNDVLLVADEVATGLGRLGSLAEYDAQNSRPDMVAYSKMLTGGYLPLAATLTTGRIRDAFGGSYDDNTHMFHGHTFTGNPLAAALACRNLELYKERSLVKHVRQMSGVMDECLAGMNHAHTVQNVSHKGLLAGIGLDWEPPRGSSANRIIYGYGRKNGVYLRTLGNTVLVVPPLAISGDDLEQMLSRIDATIRDIFG